MSLSIHSTRSTERRVTLTQSVKAEARRLGFEIVGVARADRPLEEDFARYEAFLGAGFHGDMGYLAEDREVRRRLDGEGMLVGARSVICVARSYKRPEAETAEDEGFAGHVARYARGQDYHNGLRKKLRKLAAYVRGLDEDAGASASESESASASERVRVPVAARPMIDDAPILERAWAARAGLGFIGKNGLLIVPGHGSFVLLGEVVTTLELEPDEPLPGRCGSCTACLDACPTAAFPAPFVLDARRCIAYLTIEAKSVAEVSLRPGIGERAFGCDVCQEVCPFNAGRAEGADLRMFRPHERLTELTLEGVLDLDDAAFATLKEGSPLGRPGRDGLRRNAAIALGNRTNSSACDRDGAREILSAHRDDESAPVREAVAWALEALEGRATPPAKPPR